jgi:hypothetical protein
MVEYIPCYGAPREKKGRLEVWRVRDIESLVDAVDRVHHFTIYITS